ncbi:YczE/YyaS/YitT family protein [Isobaculum melis]|uniref:Uncharacterized membrane protein YczE n=1 Tax=Isobaculum melis TaxID=142588 RepID=A0A1H9SBI4_9LACT|nr:hypothetical protein [Isobaculum melis]SER82372.1 Uncharacterized membrane protein YczE [Isobaculum melis]
MKKLIKTFIFYVLSAFGISLTIKASIGVSSFNSMNVAIAEVLPIKVGTITTITNLAFLLFCFLLSKKNILKDYLLIFSALICFGLVINFFLYDILSPITIDAYFLNVGLFILGTGIAGFGTGRVLAIGVLKFPIEKFCELLATKTRHSFAWYRYGLDLLFVTTSLILSFVCHLPILVREGTLLSLFLLSGVISWSKNLNLQALS